MSAIKNKITFAKLNCTMFNQEGKWVVQTSDETKTYPTRAEALCSALGGNRTPFTPEKANRILAI